MKHQMTNEEFSRRYYEARARVDRIYAMRGARMRQLAREAGIDPGIWPIHLHNAYISYKQGRPWEGVDSQKLRYMRWKERHMYDAHRILDQYYLRMTKEEGYQLVPWKIGL